MTEYERAQQKLAYDRRVENLRYGGVMNTSETAVDGSPSSAGVLIDSEGFYGAGANQDKDDANVRILANGDAFFSGRFNLGGTQITIGPTDDIQEALDEVEEAGGGTVYLDVGEYTLTSDINVPSGVTLQGVSRDAVIIDCDGSYAVKITGTDVYSTGTVTINNGDTAVVGVGTTWTSDMVGRFIFLDGLWYETTAHTNHTNIQITEYHGENLSGASYVLVNTNFAGKIIDTTIHGATGAGVVVQYAQECQLGNLVVYDCGTGVDMDYVVFPKLELTASENGVNLNMNFVEGFSIDFSEFNFSTTGAGIIMTDTRNATLFNSSISDNLTNGISATRCSKIAFISFDISGNGAKGSEFISDCNDNQFAQGVFSNNGSDAIKLTATSDRNIVNAVSLTDNTGYGVNIANANCDNNILIGVIASGNGSGSVSDSGTGTLKSTAVNIIP